MASPSQATPRTILLVDDEPELRHILAESLELAGYAVVQAGTAEEALDLARGRRDLLLLISDVRLPGMCGVDLAELLAAPPARLRAILISGYFLPRTIRFRLLRKPFTIRQLEAAIRDELDRPTPPPHAGFAVSP